VDWIAQAEVQRVFPNRIEIALAERDAFAIWQIDGTYKVIGRDGVPMTGLDPKTLASLPLVTGPGANVAAAEFVNQISAMPDLFVKVHAAARVGQRRWNVYLDNGVKIALPEIGVDAALREVAALDAGQNILSKGIQEIDVRQQGRIIVALAEAKDSAVASAPRMAAKSQQ
jgi:cell division protein FtsQ